MGNQTFQDISSLDLRSELARLEAESVEFARKVAEAQTRLTALKMEAGNRSQRINSIKQEIEKRDRPAVEPRVSDHALLRYIERVMDLDVEGIRAAILSPAIVAAIRAGASGCTVNGVKFVVNGATIVTTLGEEQRFKKATRKGRVVEIEDLDAGLNEYYEQRAENGGTP